MQIDIATRYKTAFKIEHSRAVELFIMISAILIMMKMYAKAV